MPNRQAKIKVIREKQAAFARPTQQGKFEFFPSKVAK